MTEPPASPAAAESASPSSPSAATRTDTAAPSSPPTIDPSSIKTVSVEQRHNKVEAGAFAATPAAGRSFAEFLAGLPDILEARSFRAVVDAIVAATQDRRAVVCMIGGHVVKTGLAPVLIEMMRRGAITHLASNGSAVIHDFEVARWGATSEDVEAGLADGTFGMAEETGREMNEAVTRGAVAGMGLGESLAAALEAAHEAGSLAAPENSLLLQSQKLGIGFTAHAAIGAEIIHQHPATDGAAIGKTSLTDFHRLAAHLENLDGGVVLNIGSAVMMPEVFLKALTICRNVNDGRPRAFVAADFDMQRHYRPRVNVVERPTRSGGGRGYSITGHHEIMVPLLGWGVMEGLMGDRSSELGNAGTGTD